MGDDFNAFIGFIISRLGATDVLKIIDTATKSMRYECPNCGATLNRGTSPCSKCGTPLRWF